MRTLTIIGAFAAMVWLAALAEADEGPASLASEEVPRSKQTSVGLYVTAADAYDRWKANPAHVKILDVRTVEEYIFVGHAEMAWNIPFASQTYEWDDGGYFAMTPNPDFVSRVKEWAAPDDTIMVMCRSGGRSARSVNLLGEAGFINVYNIIDGMEGDMVRDPDSADHGKRLKNGWKNSGLPWTYDLDPQRMRLPERK